MMYNSLVTAYFFEPKHVGTIEPSVFSRCLHQQSSTSNCNFSLAASIDRQSNFDRACFKAKGSPFLIAGLEYICETLEGTNLDSHPSISYEQLVEVLALPRTNYAIAVLMEEAYRKLILMFKNA